MLFETKFRQFDFHIKKSQKNVDLKHHQIRLRITEKKTTNSIYHIHHPKFPTQYINNPIRQIPK